MKRIKKRKRCSGIVLYAVFICIACAAKANADAETPTATGETAIYYGIDNGAALHNPLMGWQCYGDPQEIASGGIPDVFDIGVVRCSWDRLEPTKNKYDFSLLDQAIDRLKQDGKTVYLRLYLMPDNVWQIAGYPEWIKQEPGIGTFKHIHFDNLNGNGPYDFAHPDYSSPVWQSLVSNFLKQVAAHYRDGHVDVIDARAYGLYGEWDSRWGNYWNENDPAYPANKTAVLSQIVDIYKEAFKNHQLTRITFNVSSESFATAAGARAYLRQAALDKAYGAGFAVRFDGVGTGADFDPLRHVMRTVINDYFPASPVFAETWFGWNPDVYNVEATYRNFLKVRSNGITYGFSVNGYQQAINYDADFFVNGLKPNADGEQMGYRILPVSIKYNRCVGAGTPLRITSQWKNSGAGVLYRHYPLKLSLVDASGQEAYVKICTDFDITHLVKDKLYSYSTTLNLSVPPGSYKLQIALVDKNNGNRNAILLPIGDADNQTAGYIVGTITVYPN